MKGFPFLERIFVRIMAFNMLLVFLIIAVFLSLDIYENQLLKLLEHAMVQQGRFFSAAVPADEDIRDASRRILGSLERRHEARIRIIAKDGSLLADSSTISKSETIEALSAEKSGTSKRIPAEENGENTQSGSESLPEESFLYRTATYPFRLLRALFNPPPIPLGEEGYYSDSDFLKGEEILNAFDGKYGAATRISSGGQRSVTLYSAIPIRTGDEIPAVVLISQSTYRILRDLYELRLEVLKVFITALVFAVSFSFVISTTITRPIRKLIGQARDILQNREKLKSVFPHDKRHDEVGELSRTLSELTSRLDKRINYIESFASDVSHEFKNPMASIRSAAETAAEIKDPGKRKVFIDSILKDIYRLEVLISGVREISKIDSGLPEDNFIKFDFILLLKRLLVTFRRRHKDIHFVLRHPEKDLILYADPEGMIRVFENIISNAVDFTPAGGEIMVNLANKSGVWRIGIHDRGPGIAPENLDRIFDRFFSSRTAGRKDHSGLGLSIAKVIIEKTGGRISAENREGGGSVFSILIPKASITIR